MSSRLPSFVKRFGVADGFKLYSHIKSEKSGGIKLGALKNPVYFRNKKTSDVFIFEQIFIERQYEFNIPFQPKVIVDLGANVGYSCVYFANLYPDAKIFAVEPDKGNFDVAKRNVETYKNITLIHGAVWHKSEMINLIDDGFGEAAYMIGTKAGKAVVQGYTIPEIMKMTGEQHVDILKIDIEGTEKEIFESGSEEWIPKCKLIIVETHDRYKKNSSTAVFKAMSEYDFSLELCGENMVLYNNKLTDPYEKQKG